MSYAIITLDTKLKCTDFYLGDTDYAGQNSDD